MLQIEGAPPPCGDGVGISLYLKKYLVMSPRWVLTHMVMSPRWVLTHMVMSPRWVLTHMVMSPGVGMKKVVMSPPSPHRGVAHLEFEPHITFQFAKLVN